MVNVHFRLWCGFASLLCGGCGLSHSEEPIEVKTSYASATAFDLGRQSMVPWRNPAADTRLFFPGATDADIARSPRLISLAPHRRTVLARLGPATKDIPNAIYAYPVARHGWVVPLRVPGQGGAIELVVAITPELTIRGIRVQRHRETQDVVSEVLSVRNWEKFVGAGPDGLRSEIAAGSTPQARKVSVVVATAIHALLVELHVALHP